MFIVKKITSAKGHAMPYIKILTALAGLVLLTACGGSGTDETSDNNTGGGGGGGGGGNATDCMINPFHDDCLTNNAPALILRQTACLADSTTNPSCVGETGIITTFCTANPFHNSSACTDASYLPARQMQCVVDSTTNPNCTTLLGGIVDPTDITGHADLPATVAEAIANTDIRSFFLSVDADGVIDTTGLSATPATLSRKGDMRDGVTYVLSVISSVQSFVGILPSTNLGAPLPSTTADAAWVGRYYDGLNGGTNDITFNINFNAGTIDARDTQMTNITIFDLGFTPAGIITGDVNFTYSGNSDTAQARGLIGEQGLVGGFANTDGGFFGGQLYGGFVADAPPCSETNTCVDTAD